MKSKEAIRNKIIRYANLTWNTRRTDNLNPLVHLIIEEVCNELFLLDNKLTDIDSTILEKLVQNLSPSGFRYVRPAHGILHIKPEIPQYKLDRESEFLMKDIPSGLKGKISIPPAFTPVTDVTLINGSVRYLFFGRTLWTMDADGKKNSLVHTELKAPYNTLWIQLELHAALKELKNLNLYLDFPQLNDDHDYYDVMDESVWNCAGKNLQVRRGIPISTIKGANATEQDILNYYKKRYWTISDTLYTDEASTNLPPELQNIIDEETVRSLTPGMWLSIKFPAHFLQEDIDRLFVAINTFPAINRRYNELRLSLDDFSGITALSSEPGEEFLEIENIKDSSQYVYKPDEIITEKNKGFYSVDPIRKKDLNDSRIYDNLERFIDTLQSEKAVFPDIDEDKIQFVLNSISDILNQENQKLDLNILNDYAEVARLAISPIADVTSIGVEYWTSLASRLNGLPRGTAMMASKIPALNKSDAILLSDVKGGRTFYDMESLKAINRFYLVSKGQIITKYNIICFCEIEVGMYCSCINVNRKAKISSRNKEGIINVMEVQLTPKTQYTDYFNEKGILNDLKIRLSEYSPPHYHYVIKVIVSGDMPENIPMSLSQNFSNH